MSSQTSRIGFSTVTGHYQEELVKHVNDLDLNKWIDGYKASYCPEASHESLPLGSVKQSDPINLA